VVIAEAAVVVTTVTVMQCGPAVAWAQRAEAGGEERGMGASWIAV
jgi:hypothetical protein